MSQRSGASRSNNINREVRSRSDDELGDLFGEPIFNQLQGSIGERNEVSLCMVTNFDCIGFLEGDERNSIL
jgi:hypothetical protein